MLCLYDVVVRDYRGAGWSVLVLLSGRTVSSSFSVGAAPQYTDQYGRLNGPPFPPFIARHDGIHRTITDDYLHICSFFTLQHWEFVCVILIFCLSAVSQKM